MIVSSSKRLASLVDDILDFSKLKNQEIELLQKPISMHALADVVLHTCRPLVRGKDLQLINGIVSQLLYNELPKWLRGLAE